MLYQNKLQTISLGLLVGLFAVVASHADASSISCDESEGHEVTTIMSEKSLPDFEVTGPSAFYFNMHLRPYSVMEPVDTFELNGGGSIENCINHNSSYTVKFSAKETVLIDPNDPNVALDAMWDNALQRVRDRNTPWVEIMNNDDATGTITQFMLTIGDEDFHFSDEAFGNLILESESDADSMNLSASTVQNGNKLIVNINGGLAPGEKARFRIDIAPDDPNAFALEDYRLVLFDMNGNNDGDNSVVSIQEEFCDCNPIPEPGSLVILAISGLALCGTYWRKRQAAA